MSKVRLHATGLRMSGSRSHDTHFGINIFPMMAFMHASRIRRVIECLWT